METFLLIKSFAGLILVCGIILLITILLKRFNVGNLVAFSKGRMSVVDKIYLNDKTQIIVLNKQDTQYVLLLSKDGNLLLDKSTIDNMDKN